MCILEDGVAGPDTGSNPTGNWAALSKICFSHHTVPAKMVFLSVMRLSDFGHSLLFTALLEKLLTP